MKDIHPQILSKIQSSFRSGMGTTNLIFCVRWLQEKCMEHHIPIYQVFVDLTKGFGTINREALWLIISKLGCPPIFLKMFKKLHWNIKDTMAFNGEISEVIAINNEVKQGDILTPTIFTIYFTTVFSNDFHD